MKIDDLLPADYNPRKDLKPGDLEYEKIRKSIENYGYIEPIVVNAKNKNTVIGGHQRLKILKELGYNEVECSIVKLDWDEEKALNIALNKLSGEWDVDKLKTILTELEDIDVDMELSGFDKSELDELFENDGGFGSSSSNGSGGDIITGSDNASLADRFIIPPFSVFDCKQGYWINRKKLWKELGIKSEIGREAKSYTTEHISDNYGRKSMSGTSIFDPVLCEIIYTWFNIPGGYILDPFSGGSVRGIVAGKLGYKYFGVDLSEEQIKANEENLQEVDPDKFITKNIEWKIDDSLNIDNYTKENSFDLIFSCPPYFDLEKYSDKTNDLSNMSYDNFLDAYSEIIEKSCSKLKNDRFAVFVVSDIRDKKGCYRNFVSITKELFISQGLSLYNDVVLIDMLGTAMIRAPKVFTAARKLVKVHQNVLIFYKGNVKNISNLHKDIDISDLSGDDA
jgi:DNA modification methylase